MKYYVIRSGLTGHLIFLSDIQNKNCVISGPFDGYFEAKKYARQKVYPTAKDRDEDLGIFLQDEDDNSVWYRVCYVGSKNTIYFTRI